MKQDAMATMRVTAFRYNEQRLLEVLQDWLHPQGMLQAAALGAQRKRKNNRKYLYDPALELTEENLFECFYDLVQEMMKRMKKVQGNIKANEKLLARDEPSDEAMSQASQARDESKERNRNKREVIDVDMLNRRRLMSDLEIEERQYCALRIAEYLENNMV